MASDVTAAPSRLHFLDRVYVWAMFAVFLLHCLSIFDNAADWSVKNSQTHMGFTILLGFIHFWAMPVFFFMAGASIHFTLQKQQVGMFLQKRVRRLLVPLIMGGILIHPLQRYIYTLTHTTFNGSYSTFYTNYWRDILQILRFHPLEITQKNLDGHLWFLHYLFTISLFYLPIFLYFRQQPPPKIIARCLKPGHIFLLAIPFSLIQFIVRPLFPGYANGADYLYWALLVIYGYFILHDQRFIESLQPTRRWALISSLLTSGALFATQKLLKAEFCFYAPDYSWQCYLFQSFYTFVAWSFILFLIALAYTTFNTPSPYLTYSREAILPIYILHHPIIILVGYEIVSWPLGMVPKFLLIMVIAFVLTITVYHFLIRKSNWLRFLFGLKPQEQT